MEVICLQCQQAVELENVRHRKVCPVCGAINPPTQLPDGTRVAGFEVSGVLGAGGMGVVYRAMQLNLQRMVAFKVLNDALAADHEFVTRFFREARAAAALSHPNIVQAYDAGIGEDGICYFAMELINGPTYDALLEHHGKFVESDVRQIALKVSQAMEYAWERQQLSHGDIKPENLIQDDLMGVKLSDLGLARSSFEASRDESVMATPLYAPPEIVSGASSDINPQSDMYSLGATLYHMLTGAPLFPDTDPYAAAHRHVTDTYTPLTHYGVSANFSALVDSLLRKNPDERPASWSVVTRRLEEIILTPCGRTHKKVRKLKRMTTVAAGIAVVVTLALAGVMAYNILKVREGYNPDGTDRFSKAWIALEAQTASGNDADHLASLDAFLQDVPEEHPAADSARRLHAIFAKRVETAHRDIARRAVEREAVLKAVMPPIETVEQIDLTGLDNSQLNRHLKALRDAETAYGKANKDDLPPTLDEQLMTQLRRVSAEIAMRSRSHIDKVNAENLETRRAMETACALALRAPSPVADLENRLSPLCYYEFVRRTAELLAENSASTVDFVERWQPDRPLSLGTLQALGIIKEMFKSTTGPKDVVTTHFSKLEGKTVPLSFPPVVQGYRFETMRADGKIRLDLIDRQTRARIFKFVTFEELSSEALDDLLSMTFNGAIDKLPHADQNALLRHACASSNVTFLERFRTACSGTSEDARLRLKILDDFTHSAENLATVMVLKQSVDALRAKDDLAALAHFERFRKVISDTIPIHVSDLAPAMQSYCSAMLPEATYHTFRDAAGKDPRFPLTAYAQFATCASFSEPDNAKLLTDFGTRLRQFAGKSADGEDAPFIHGGRPDAGTTLATFERMGDDRRVKEVSERKVLTEAVVRMNAGDWKLIRTLMNSRNYPAFIGTCDKPYPWDAALLYGFTLAVRHYGAEPHYKDATKLLSAGVGVPNQFGPALLMADLAFQSGDFATAANIRKHELDRSKPQSSTRVAILGLLASSVTTDDPKKFTEVLTETIRDLRRLRLEDEVSRCQMIRSLISRRDPTLTEDEVRILLASPHASDLWARLLLSIIAQNMIRGIEYHIDWKAFYDAIEKVMPDHIGGGALWHEYWTFRLARAFDDKTILSDLDGLRKTPGLQTISDALDLELLRMALAVREGRLSPAGAERCFLTYVDNVASAPNYYKTEARTLFSSNEELVTAAKLSAWTPRDAFNSYVCASATGIHSGAPILEAERLSPKLSPSERLLLLKIRKNWN